MAKTQAKRPLPVGHMRRILTGLKRHKITAFFAVFTVALILYLGGSWVVLQVQIHFERKNFYRVSNDINRLSMELKNLNFPKNENYCYYESSTIEFIQGERICVTRAIINMQGITRDQSLKLTPRINKIVEHQFVIKKNKALNYALSSYDFTDLGINCTYSIFYYDDTIIASNRDSSASSTGKDLLVEISCSEVVKAEYFPVAKS